MTNDDSYRQQAAKLRRQARRERNVPTRLDVWSFLPKGTTDWPIRLGNTVRNNAVYE
jgi:hypothetical protein